jgi:tetratricopeptide (TPR) repeat protein
MVHSADQPLPKAKKQGRLNASMSPLDSSPEEPPQEQLNALVALFSQERMEDVLVKATSMVAEFPGAAILHNILGAANAGLHNVDGAIKNFENALKINPDYAEAHNSLGIALQSQGRHDEAIASFDRALRIKPGFAEAHNNRGGALQDRGHLQEAIASFANALRINPRFAEAYNNLGSALKDQGRTEEAIASLGRALKIRPGYAEAHSNLCGIYEKQNKLEELEKAIENAALHCGKDNPEILVRYAQLAGRKNKLEDAVSYLNKVKAEGLRPSLKSAYFSLLGKVCDRLGRFEEAFSAFEKQNKIASASKEAAKLKADGFLNSVRSAKKAWTADVKPVWTSTTVGMTQASPSFLVGFPRSGTTLLDAILRSHPGISVVEEKPMVGAMSRAFKRGYAIENLNGLSEAGALELRAAYFNELKRHLYQNGGGKLVVDKYPLNIVHVGLIHRVFPDAKFILALRHPCDCVLSCFIQTFKLNEAMMSFLSLEQSAALYAAVMELWAAYRGKLNLDVHVLKYEDLVQDLEVTCRPLIRFLGLEWDDNLHNYQKTALERGSINTPSYSQIIQPLYKQASGRWSNYRKQMEPVLPVLKPWIEAFGY